MYIILAVGFFKWKKLILIVKKENFTHFTFLNYHRSGMGNKIFFFYQQLHWNLMHGAYMRVRVCVCVSECVCVCE